MAALFTTTVHAYRHPRQDCQLDSAQQLSSAIVLNGYA